MAHLSYRADLFLRNLLFLTLLLFSILGDAQTYEKLNVKTLTVGTNTAADSSSIFDARSTAKGALLPRMTTAQRTAIASPIKGLLVYDTDLNDLYQYNGSSWNRMASGTVPVAQGGTGLTSGTSGGILGFTASGTLASSSALTANQVVIGGGAGATPSTLAAGSQYQSLVMGASNPGYSAVPLNQTAATSGQLPSSRGGTGQDLSASSGALSISTGTVSAGTLSIGNGGTGQTSQTAAFNALDPLTTKGDIAVHDGTNTVRQAIGTDGYVLTADSTQTNGLKWAVGGGAGGIFAGGQNLISNNSFEASTTGWTASGGTFQRETGAGNVIPPGVGSASWDPSATSQTLTFTATTITSNDGLSGRNGVVSCGIKTAATDLLLQAYDGTNNLVSQAVTPSSAGFVRTSLNFVFPSSGTTQIRFSSQSNSAIAYIDDCFLGLAEGFNISQVNQAEIYGTFTYAQNASCFWSKTANNWNSFSVATCGTGTATGNALAPSSTLPAIRFTNLPPGRYEVSVNATIRTDYTTTTTSCLYGVWDGTNRRSVVLGTASSTSTTDVAFGLGASFEYTAAQSSITFEVQANRTAGGGNCYVLNNDNADQTFNIVVKRFPTSGDTAYQSNLTDWFAIADITGANPSLGISNVSSYTEITDAGLTMTPVSGSQPIGIMCSGTNAATAPSTGATTCAAGSESVGANFNIPVAGWYEICFDAAHRMQGDASDTVQNAFQVVETPTNAQTLTQECGPRLNTTITAAATDQVQGPPGRYCGQCNFSSAGTKGVRLMYEQLQVNTPDSVELIADDAATVGQRRVRLTVRPMRYSMSTPLLVGSVISNSTGVERIERAELNCDASSSITSQSGSWLTAIGNRSTAACSITIAAGIFSAAPSCTFTVKATAVQATAVNMTSATAGTVYGAGADYDGYLICQGPR